MTAHPTDRLPGLSPEGLDRLTAAVEAIKLIGPPPPDGGDDRRFGRFRLLRVLGQGKFGVVFLAEDPHAGRLVALKLPQPAALLEPELAARFRREVEAAGGLDHPNIVPVLETGAVGPVAYIALPYIAGPTLAEWLSQAGPLPARRAAALAADLADAAHYAHERGVLHCDLKPANVLLDGDRPRVADFGLARLLGHDPRLTHTHLVAGTPPYMAPEQALGTRRELTPRCDVYAICAILYELLTGTAPYGAPSEAEQLRRLLDPDAAPAPPRRLRPALPRDLEAVVLKGLEKAPARRYASAAELAGDLRRWLGGQAVRARPPSWAARAARWARRRPHFPLTLAGLVLAVAGLGASTARLAEERRRTWAEAIARAEALREKQDAVEETAQALACVRREREAADARFRAALKLAARQCREAEELMAAGRGEEARRELIGLLGVVRAGAGHCPADDASRGELLAVAVTASERLAALREYDQAARFAACAVRVLHQRPPGAAAPPELADRARRALRQAELFAARRGAGGRAAPSPPPRTPARSPGRGPW